LMMIASLRKKLRLQKALETLSSLCSAIVEFVLKSLLDVAVTRMKCAGRDVELHSNCLLHMPVQQKLPAQTLMRIHRWVAESGSDDTLSSLLNDCSGRRSTKSSPWKPSDAWPERAAD
jgi:hypothetical protein